MNPSDAKPPSENDRHFADRVSGGDFEFHNPVRLVHGAGAIDQLGQWARQTIVDRTAKETRVLLVSDPDLLSVGHPERGQTSLENAGMSVKLFSDFGENPDADMVRRGVAAAAEFDPHLIVAIGGGSSMDCAKAIDLAYCCGGDITDYRGHHNATADLLPIIVAPTTAGTGSEVQSFAIIADDKTHLKMPVGDPQMMPKIAILDPELTRSQPPRVAALTGIDALSHAVEAYVTKDRNAMSITLARQAFALLVDAMPTMLDRPDDLSARRDMQIGATLAGMAIEASMLGAAHATANPLTAEHDVPHGQAVAITLPQVVRLNGTKCARWYDELCRELPDRHPSKNDTHPNDDTRFGVDTHADDRHRRYDPADAPERLAHHLEWLVRRAGLANHLDELSIDGSRIDRWVDAALPQWTGTFNPVELNRDIIHGLYRRMLQPEPQRDPS